MKITKITCLVFIKSACFYDLRLLLTIGIFLIFTRDIGAATPNFVVIMADDLGAGELACYGNRKHRTPHLDELARLPAPENLVPCPFIERKRKTWQN